MNLTNFVFPCFLLFFELAHAHKRIWQIHRTHVILSRIQRIKRFFIRCLFMNYKEKLEMALRTSSRHATQVAILFIPIHSTMTCHPIDNFSNFSKFLIIKKRYMPFTHKLSNRSSNMYKLLEESSGSGLLCGRKKISPKL